MYSFAYLEPVCCSMPSSNCCFLTYIQISQEAGQVVWYSHLFQNFPQFIAIHTVKGFGIVNLDESERREWKSWLKAQHSEDEDHGIRSHHFQNFPQLIVIHTVTGFGAAVLAAQTLLSRLSLVLSAFLCWLHCKADLLLQVARWLPVAPDFTICPLNNLSNGDNASVWTRNVVLESSVLWL